MWGIWSANKKVAYTSWPTACKLANISVISVFEFALQCVLNTLAHNNKINNKNHNKPHHKYMIRYWIKPKVGWDNEQSTSPHRQVTKLLTARSAPKISHTSLSAPLTHFTYFFTFYRPTKIKLASAHKYIHILYLNMVCVYS